MKRVLAWLIFVCFPLLYAGAQTTAQISGTVQDSSGAAVAGAQVQVTDVDTNAIRTDANERRWRLPLSEPPHWPLQTAGDQRGVRHIRSNWELSCR